MNMLVVTIIICLIGSFSIPKETYLQSCYSEFSSNSTEYVLVVKKSIVQKSHLLL